MPTPPRPLDDLFGDLAPLEPIAAAPGTPAAPSAGAPAAPGPLGADLFGDLAPLDGAPAGSGAAADDGEAAELFEAAVAAPAYREEAFTSAATGAAADLDLGPVRLAPQAIDVDLSLPSLDLGDGPPAEPLAPKVIVVRSEEELRERLAAAGATPPPSRPSAVGRGGRRLWEFWHYTLGWPARPDELAYVLPRLGRRLAVVAGLPLLLAGLVGWGRLGGLYPESFGDATTAAAWRRGVVEYDRLGGSVLYDTIDGTRLPRNDAAAVAKLYARFWPALSKALGGDGGDLAAIATPELVASLPAWAKAHALSAASAYEPALLDANALHFDAATPNDAPTAVTLVPATTTLLPGGTAYGRIALTAVRATPNDPWRISAVEAVTAYEWFIGGEPEEFNIAP